MIDPHHSRLSIVRQCALAGISRSSFYYQEKAESLLNLKLMRQIGEQWLRTPFFGSRRMAKYLRCEGYNVSRKRVRRLMRKIEVVQT
jgi:putative transposase